MRVLLATLAAVAVLSVVTTTLAGPILRIAFRNNSDKTITEAYVVVPGRDWGPNQVAGKPIAPKKRAQLILEDGANKCVADLRLVTGDGTTFERRVNFCGNPNFTYHGR
ncbi:MAG TPA: hypothetical protein PK286_14300 [Devosia sp.]|nr:hypothetical protein [Devosia sp.]